MAPFLSLADLLVFATILLGLFFSSISADAVPLPEAVSTETKSEGDGGGVQKRDGAVEKESGARKRDGAVLGESGVLKRDGVGRVEDVRLVGAVASPKTPVNASGASGEFEAITMTTTLAVEATTTTSNGTIPEGLGDDALQNRGMIVRMTYVLCGFSLLIIVYFLVKAVQLRRAKSRTRQYGVLTENLDSPLGIDEESDEEVEVFEVNGSNLRGGRAQKTGNTAADRLLP